MAAQERLNRREFIATGVGGAVGLAALPTASAAYAGPPQSIRDRFPRLAREVFVNGAGGTPLGRFAEAGIGRYLDFLRLGPGEGRGEYHAEVWGGVRARFAKLIGAKESEIGLVECTKEGEQIVLDGLGALRTGGNVVTNDLHFSGSLHNLVGLQRAGRDVRIVRSRDLAVSLDRMADAIDDDTVLVTVSLVSNVNGHVEAIAELADLAHDRGAIVFADIIQAVGAMPVDVKAMGIDVAATSSYKWLYGVHGAGFLYVREDLQGALLPDALFPGHVVRNYPPFRPGTDPAADPYAFAAPADARRYQPGHVSYIGYAAVYEGLGFLEEVGVERIQRHAVALNRRLLEQLDPARYRVLSTHLDTSPILALEARDFEGLRTRLDRSEVVVGIGGDKWNEVRISPAIYNTEADMDRVAEVLDG